MTESFNLYSAGVLLVHYSGAGFIPTWLDPLVPVEERVSEKSIQSSSTLTLLACPEGPPPDTSQNKWVTPTLRTSVTSSQPTGNQ